MGLFDTLKRKLAVLVASPPTIAQRAAPRLQEQLRAESRTRRGNIPLFKGRPKWSANIPTTVTARGDELDINAADWVLDKARANGLTEKTSAILHEEARAVARGK